MKPSHLRHVLATSALLLLAANGCGGGGAENGAAFTPAANVMVRVPQPVPVGEQTGVLIADHASTRTLSAGAAASRRAAVLITSPIASGLPILRQRDHRLARCDADADMQLAGQLTDTLTDQQPAANRPLWIILMRRDRTEQGHDPITGELCNQ